MSTKDRVIQLIQEGKTTKEISIILDISVDGVRYHREKGKAEYCKKRIKKISAHRIKIKMKAVDYSGGKCLRCGYNICIDCLTFHHLDPLTKESQILSGGWTLSWLRVKPELDKTIMFCNRCHTEFHAGAWIMTEDLIQEQSRRRFLYVEKDLSCYEVSKGKTLYRNQHSLPRSSMLEQEAVNFEVAGWNPAEAAII